MSYLKDELQQFQKFSHWNISLEKWENTEQDPEHTRNLSEIWIDRLYKEQSKYNTGDKSTLNLNNKKNDSWNSSNTDSTVPPEGTFQWWVEKVVQKQDKKRFWKLNKNSKSVLQFSKENLLIKEWDSISDVTRELWINSSHISTCCLWRRKTTWWFIWRYL